MSTFVVDSSVWVAGFIEEDSHHEDGLTFLQTLSQGRHICHLPRLVFVETCSAVARRDRRTSSAMVMPVRQSFFAWERATRIFWYDLDARRSDLAADVGYRFRLRGSDAVLAALAEDLSLPLFTFDKELENRLAREHN